MNGPSDSDKRDAVERWARETGLWREVSHPEPSGDGWHVAMLRDGRFHFWRGKSDPRVRYVDTDTALLAALCIEGGHTLDVGRCPECRGTGEVPGDPPSWANPYGEPPEPCPCFDGRHTIEAARIVLDAAPAVAEWSCFGAHVLALRYECAPIDAMLEIRDRLDLLADRFQCAGDPLGEWLALWLLGRDGWQDVATNGLGRV